MINPKSIIYATICKHCSNAEEVTNEIWDNLYNSGCEEIGEIGLPAIVLEKYGKGEFIPSFIELEEDEFYLDEDEEDGYGY